MSCEKAIENLTKRQLDCLCLWLRNNTHIEIAEILHISKRTVETHIESIKKYFKLKKKYEIYDVIEQNGEMPLIYLRAKALLNE